MHTAQTDIILWQSLAIFLLIAALLGILLGLLLVFKPDRMERASRVANHWVSTRHLDQFLDRSISIEQWFYQYHRPLGILIIIGAGYLFVYFGMLFDKAAALQRMVGHLPASLLDGLLDAFVFAALFGAVVALFVGLALWLRPALLRGIEKYANQWITLRHVTAVLDVQHDHVERFVACHARQVGGLLLLASIYLSIVMFLWLV
ncbi:MAG: hypothetical protein WC208_02970 [Gallionella sp.]|jgi:hypothetical protein